MLYFFLDQEQPWGFDPADKGRWQVIYTDRPREQLSEQPAPQGLWEESHFNAKPVAFRAVQTYPYWQDDRVYSDDMTDDETEVYEELCESVFNGEPPHHFFGHPAAEQGNNMDLECQLASNGIYCGSGNPADDPRVPPLLPGRSDWLMLFQLATDDDAGMMWGDCGKLYFWIKKQDLAAQRFQNCWMILQCG